AAKYGNGWSWNDYDASYMPERSPFPIHGNIVTIRDTAHTVPGIFINKATYAGAYQNGYRIERTYDGIFNAVESKTKFNGDEIPFVTGQSTTNRLLKEILGKVQVFASESQVKAADPRRIIYSQPTDSLLKPMMHRSDNFFAEQSLLMVSNQLLGEMNDARVIDSIMKTDFRDLPQQPRWADGSGLSRYNLFTPQDLVFILNKMKEEYGMERIKEIFPTGNEGTLRNYYTTEEGYIYAKTGTLSGVVAISGFLYTTENKLLVFSVLVNNHRSSATDVRRAVERFIRELRKKG
ncbi:MAG TPA: D-alanyl-D-alanine carboxypeptidase, partial [Flavisolibacter sp.]